MTSLSLNYLLRSNTVTGRVLGLQHMDLGWANKHDTHLEKNEGAKMPTKTPEKTTGSG
jgi:hypothetical protein